MKKAYGLDGMDGTRFYEFDFTQEIVEGETTSGRKERLGQVKAWFRRGMDEGVGDDGKLKGSFKLAQYVELRTLRVESSAKAGTAHLVKEANLAFALNTQLFSLIELSAPSPSLSMKTQANPPRELRYYERMEIERKAREEQRLLVEGPVAPVTWRQRIERFGLFALTAFMGVFITQVVYRFLMRYSGRSGVVPRQDL